MPQPSRSLVSLGLACILTASGCVGGGPTAPTTPKPTKKPVTTRPSAGPTMPAGGGSVAAQLAALSSLETLAVQAGQAATLTGKVKLISDRGGALISNNGGSIISDNGGGIISDNGGGIISNNSGAIISDNGGGLVSNNGGGLVSNNGGGLVSNNGGGLTSKTKYGLAQAAPGLALFALADAVISLHDAQGRVVVDAAGKPLTATTGPDGSYALAGALPPGNLVAKIRLWNGGELMAMVARDGAGQLTLDLDTASTMGAAYVLGQFVKGDQKTFDKLPRSENERLTRDLDAVRGYVKGAFKYDAKLLTEATDALRARVPAVDETIEDVKALLIGQVDLGAGRPATEVAISDPIAIHVRKSGEVLVAERFVGRVRAIDAAGRLTTLVDGAFGAFKVNYPTLSEVIEGADGALYVCAQRTARVFRLDPSGKAEPWVGTGTQGRNPLGAALDTQIVPRALALGADGTLYVAERRGDGKELKAFAPRLLAVKDGQVTEVPGGTWGEGNLQAVQLGPDGAFYLLHQIANGGRGKLLKLHEGVLTTIATDLGCEDEADMVRGADGTLYVSENLDGRLTAFAPDGTRRVLAGPDAVEEGGKGVRVPGGLGLGPDGTLYVADQATSQVFARTPAGAWRVFAGTQTVAQDGDVTNFAISLPGGAAFDAQGGLFVSEGGSHSIKRFAGGKLEIFAGGLRGGAGDGGPAAQARLSAPTGLAWRDGALWFIDSGNRSLRRIGADGVVATVAGGVAGKTRVAPGASVPAREIDLAGGIDVAIGPDGRPYWTNQEAGQVQRLNGAAVEGVLGSGLTGGEKLDFAAIFAGLVDPDPAKANLNFPFGLAFDAAGDLYVVDAPACQILKVTKPGTPEARVEGYAGMTVTEALAAAADVDPANPPSTEGLDKKAVGVIVPTGVTFDRDGNLIFAEAGTLNIAAFANVFGDRFPVDPTMLPQAPPRVRRIAKDGKVTTIAGPGGKFFTDPRGADALALPTAVQIDAQGRLVIIDSGANLIRILPAGAY